MLSVPEDNTNDWKYVGVTESSKMAASELTGLGRTATEQSIKYWDYSTDRYDFVAYSTGNLDMIATGDPADGTSVKVTKIDKDNLGTAAYSFKAAKAADFAQCYYTDVTPVLKANYRNPVQLTFKNLSAKVRVGLYETISGYSVKEVEFFADNTVATPATYAAATLPGDQTALDAANAVEPLYTETGGVYTAYTTYDSGVTAVFKKTADAVADPTAGTDATLFLSSGTFTEAGTITVSYPLLGTNNNTKNGYLKADVAVAPESGSTTTTKTFGTLTANYSAEEGAETAGTIYLGRTLTTATMAGDAAKEYFTYVIPANTGAALTLRVNYTLVSTDGSGEEIKVYGANAVVPANFCEWQPNYAYTYIFKISDNTNGSTEKLGGTPEGLFPITFDAVVADITDASAEQTTVTTVATPSVTTYQYGHKQGEEYKAGDIYVEVMKDGDLAVLTGNTYLYTTDNDKATEADVIDALQMSTATSPNIVGRNSLTLVPEATPIDLGAHSIPAVDGTTISVAAGESAKFTAVANKNYVFVYDYTDTPAPSEIYSYDNAASAVGATVAPTDWVANDTNPYYTKTVVAGVVTYTQVTTDWVASTAEAPKYYYKKYTNNGRSYAVKVIKTGTGY